MPTVVGMRTSLAPFLSPEGFTPPSYWALAKELHVGHELGAAAARRLTARPPRHPAGEDEPVLLVPGFLAGDYSLHVLAGTLRRHGYRTYRSAIRTNASCTNDTARRLEHRLEGIAERRGTKVRVIGHSLGGMLARGVAVRRPDLVAGVVTLGSPMMAPGTAHPILMSAAAWLVRLSEHGVPGVMSVDCIAGECARTTWEEFHGVLSPEVPLACIWSRWDGLVDPRSCVHPDGLSIEVRASHLGMAVAPHVHDVVLAELLRQRGTALRAA